MSVGMAAPRAPYASDPGRSRGRLYPTSRRADPQRVPARLRPDHPFDRLPPAEAQDPGVRLPRGRPLPDPPHPYPGGGPDRPRAGPRSSGSTRIWPRRWRWRMISAIRRSAMPASGRWTTASTRIGGFDHNAQTLRVVTALERRYPEFDGLNLTWETLEGIVKHNGPLTDRDGQADRPLSASAACRAGSPTINASLRSGALELRLARGAGRGDRRRHRL